ncbi:hypothetical protein NL389_29685, partial [Klebsiella pneumoniae]|nr:hypothetical protein [Klebsiella pneumoniae]
SNHTDPLARHRRGGRRAGHTYLIKGTGRQFKPVEQNAVLVRRTDSQSFKRNLTIEQGKICQSGLKTRRGSAC